MFSILSSRHEGKTEYLEYLIDCIFFLGNSGFILCPICLNYCTVAFIVRILKSALKYSQECSTFCLYMECIPFTDEIFYIVGFS